MHSAIDHEDSRRRKQPLRMTGAAFAAACVFTATLPCACAGPDIDGGATAQQVVSRLHPTVVKLYGAGVGNLDSYGSAVLVTSEGHCITVWNHLINTGYLTAVDSRGRRYSVNVLGTDRANDLAVLQLETTEGRSDEFPFIDLRAAESAPTGAAVIALSNMYQVATGSEPVTAVHGVIAAEAVLQARQGRWRFPVESPVYLVDAVINNSGAAGGLLALSDGTPVGLIGRELRHDATDMYVNYAVPLQTLAPVAEAIISGERRPSAIRTTETADPLSDRDLTARFGITMVPSVIDRTPAFIDGVTNDSPGGRAGLQRGDLVVLIEDSVIQSVEDLRTELASFRSGQPVSLTVNRAGQLTTVTVRIP